LKKVRAANSHDSITLIVVIHQELEEVFLPFTLLIFSITLLLTLELPSDMLLLPLFLLPVSQYW
jgi:hypothetical protein